MTLRGGKREVTGGRFKSTAARERLDASLRSIPRRLRTLTVAVILMAVPAVLNTASVQGSLVNDYGGDAALFGGSTTAAALTGFAPGWFARRMA